jgi:hypothetical protein
MLTTICPDGFTDICHQPFDLRKRTLGMDVPHILRQMPAALLAPPKLAGSVAV